MRKNLCRTIHGRADGVPEVRTICAYRVHEPAELRDVTARDLSQYVAWLREAGRSESTIQSHLRHVKAVLRWAVSNKYLPAAPAIPATPRASKRKMMKGRAVTDAEFDRFVIAIPGIVGEQHAAHWQRMARGLWLSGLRLEESMSLSWDATAPFHVITDDRGRVKLRIPAEAEKGFEDRLYPATPDFAEFLLTTPTADHTGFVFHPAYSKGRSVHRDRNGREAGRVFSAVGETSQIIVDAGRPRCGKIASKTQIRQCPRSSPFVRRAMAKARHATGVAATDAARHNPNHDGFLRRRRRRPHARRGLQSMGISPVTTMATQHFPKSTLGRVAKQADASDLKSGVAKATCGFEPRLGQYLWGNELWRFTIG